MYKPATCSQSDMPDGCSHSDRNNVRWAQLLFHPSLPRQETGAAKRTSFLIMLGEIQPRTRKKESTTRYTRIIKNREHSSSKVGLSRSERVVRFRCKTCSSTQASREAGGWYGFAAKPVNLLRPAPHLLNTGFGMAATGD